MKSSVISTIKLTFFMFMGFSFFGCADPTSGQLHDLTNNPAPENPDNPDNPTPDNPAKYAKEYWGEWLRMDTNQTWYITSSYITIGNNPSSKTVSLAKQSDRVIEVTDNGRKYYLYASRIANASFTGKIAGFDQPSQSLQRAVAGGKGWISVVIEDLNDKTNTTTTTTDGDGNFTAEDMIPGNKYEVTPEGGTPITVTPIGDGDDVGTITVSDGVNFKVSITDRDLDSSYNSGAMDTDLDMLCAKGWYASPNYGGYIYNSNPNYHFVLSIKNTGSIDATAATYKLSFDSGLQSTSGSSDILGTIEPGKSKEIDISLKCSSDSITGDYAYKKIYITINDPINSRTWNDSVSLRFFKEIVPVVFDGSARGIIITPSGQTVRPYSSIRYDTVGYGAVTGAIIPKLTGEYLFVFSGATADSESSYSFRFSAIRYDSQGYGHLITDIPDQDGPLGTDLARYEPNNTEDTATVITGGIHAYLHKNDIDYYKFHF